jgi:hypothetical protein
MAVGHRAALADACRTGETVVVRRPSGFPDNVLPARLIQGASWMLTVNSRSRSNLPVFHLAACALRLSHFIGASIQNNLIGGQPDHTCQPRRAAAHTFADRRYGAARAADDRNTPAHPEITASPSSSSRPAPRGIPGLITDLPPHNVYGERQNIGDKYRNAVGIFMNQISAGQPT